MRTLLIFLMLTSTANCTATTGDSACVAFRPIVVKRGLDPHLSRPLAEQIVAHNRAWREFCPD